MIITKEECLQALETELQKSLQMLGLPADTLNQLKEISEEELSFRDAFIQDKFIDRLKKLKPNAYCIIPSSMGPNSFTMAIKAGNKIKRLPGVLKDNHFELRYYDNELIKSSDLKECQERGVLFFEEQGLMPVLFSSHRGLVEQNTKKILEQALENNNLEKIKNLFSNLKIHEIEEEILFKVFEKSSKDAVEFFINKIDNKELRLRQVGEEDRSEIIFNKILDCARRRAARGDENNMEIAKILRNHLKKQQPNYFTESQLEQEKKWDAFFIAMNDLSELNPIDANFQQQRHLLEQTIMKTINELKLMGGIDINVKTSSNNEHPLDGALMKGSVQLIDFFIKQGAAPTTGWKYETLNNFTKNQRSALGYVLNKNPYRSEEEKTAISKILQNKLEEIEEQRAEEVLARGKLAL